MSAPAARTLRWLPPWVALLVLAAPVPAYAQIVLMLGVLAGLLWLLHRRIGAGGLLSGPGWALTCVLFCAYWLPIAIAAVDARQLWQALRAAVVDLRLLPFLWLAAAAATDARPRGQTFGALALIAAAWTVDVLIAASTGTSVLRWLYDRLPPLATGVALCKADVALPPGVGGAFGGCSDWMGMALACLSPFLLVACGQRFGWFGWAPAALAVGAALILTALPMAWIAGGLALLLTMPRASRWGTLPALVAMAGAAVLLALTLRGSAVGAATSIAALVDRGRDALCVIAAHPLNGVGAAGLEQARLDCAAGSGALGSFAAHQLMLDVLGATGAIGLLLWLAGAALAWRAWRYADAAARMRARPALLALVVAVFPLNLHLPVYGGPWGVALLLLAGLYAGSLCGREPAHPGAAQA